jgi:hypothetical protein
MDHKDEIMPYLEKYYVEPKDWYVNRWHDVKKHTKELKEEGKLSPVTGDLAFDENIFVPPYQQKVLNKYREDIQKDIDKEKKRRSYKDN